MSLTNPNHAVTAERLSEFYQEILPYLNGPESEPIVYGIRILRDESVPSAKVEYLEDAIGMTPAGMNFSTGVFDYGDWENAFFMPKPCMLKYDGTVDYYLDPNDYSKKEDGTASDIEDTSYGGNAMMEWPKIWMKIVPDSTKDNKQADIFISNVQVDEGYHDWSYHNSLSESVDHFYTAIYNGANVNNVLRSISNTTPYSEWYIATYATYAEANNPSNSYIWSIETVADRMLINFLLILIGKSTDTQSVFGKGMTTGGGSSTVGSYRSGVHNTKGLFYGKESGNSTRENAIKVFGMENWWGLQWRCGLGYIVNNGIATIKLTYGTEDGSTVTGYNFTGNGYINPNITTCSGSSGSYIVDCEFNEYGMFPITANSTGTDTTYYCDGLYFNNSGTGKVIIFGGSANTGTTIGGALAVNTDVTTSSWSVWMGACLSARPLS